MLVDLELGPGSVVGAFFAPLELLTLLSGVAAGRFLEPFGVEFSFLEVIKH